MPKVNVDINCASQEQIEALLQDWGLGTGTSSITEFHKCYGGFSGSNYACTLADGRRILLKCTNEQPRSDVEGQISALLFLRRAGDAAPSTCYPWPLKSQGVEGASNYISMQTGSPSVVLDFLPGLAADKVLAAHKNEPAVMRRLLRGAAQALAKLHSVQLPSSAELQSSGIRDAGGPDRYPGADTAAACFVGQQAQFVTEFAAAPTLGDHPFVPLHAQAVPEVVRTMRARVPRGFIHGDPFLDNLLAHEESGDVVGWIDWEDVAVGPLMFDVGCAIIGCCYRSSSGEDNQLDNDRLQEFLHAYNEVRVMQPTERELLVPFMRVALLCNATWRFRNFNLVHTGPQFAAAKDSYKELADRLVSLTIPDNVAAVEALLPPVSS